MIPAWSSRCDASVTTGGRDSPLTVAGAASALPVRAHRIPIFARGPKPAGTLAARYSPPRPRGSMPQRQNAITLHMLWFQGHIGLPVRQLTVSALADERARASSGGAFRGRIRDLFHVAAEASAGRRPVGARWRRDGQQAARPRPRWSARDRTARPSGRVHRAEPPAGGAPGPGWPQPRPGTRTCPDRVGVGPRPGRTRRLQALPIPLGRKL